VITQTLFRKNYLIFASIVLLFIVIGAGTSWVILDAQRQEFAKGPAQFVYKFFLSQDPDPYVALAKIRKNLPESGREFELVLPDGKSATDGTQLIDKDVLSKHKKNLESDGLIALSSGPFGGPPPLIMKTQKENLYLLFKPMRGGMMMPPPPHMARGDRGRPEGFPGGPPPMPGDGRMGMPDGPPPDGPPGNAQMGPPPGMGGPGGFRPPRPNGNPYYFPLVTLGSITACVLISLGIALFYQFSKYKNQAEEAFAVLSELRAGNLSVRMPVQKHNELKPLIQAFNLMADDVEGLVDNLKKADTARRNLLADLAHDLRTPLTSLRTFLEALKHSDKKISDEKRQEVVSLCFSEVEYFGNLVEDLLFLAQITEPKYSKGTEHFNFKEYVQEHIQVYQTRSPLTTFQFQNEGAENAYVTGSSKLIDRALRNAFDNSSSFAKSQVLVSLSVKDKMLVLTIDDDGPGFSEKALKEYGYKKASRILTGSSDNTRISVGIGSVIMREILTLHGGQLLAENRVQDGRIIGGRVSFSLPIT
jgi:signal transduction histidine kinase